MYRWIKKLHIYSGLLSYAGFTVWGIVGIWASFLPPPSERQPGMPSSRVVEFRVNGTETDQEVADRMIVASGLQHVGPGRRPRRDSQERLEVRYYTPNGVRRIVLLEDRGQIRIEQANTKLGEYLNIMHMQTVARQNPGWNMALWGAYNEFSLWAVLFMTASGVYMWLATRPGMRWAVWTAGAASAFVIGLVVWLR